MTIVDRVDEPKVSDVRLLEEVGGVMELDIDGGGLDAGDDGVGHLTVLR